VAEARVLIVDDDDGVRFGITDYLSQQGFTTAEAATCAAALDVFRKFLPDVAVVDYSLPDGNALDLLPRLRSISASTPVVILTAHGSIDLAVEAIKLGAEQFMTKPVELAALLILLRRIVENQRNRNKLLARRPSSSRAPNPFVGSSAAIRMLRDQATRVAGAERPILIHGETGSGKGVLAAWLHAKGPRADAAFVDLNCAGLSREFLESELFGHERGAFTGAVTAKIGMFDVAHRGTLFLDEIGDIDPTVQPKLLKVIEEKKFRRMGDVRDRVVDAQLIAATHRDLRALVQENRFRADLYFRVSTLPLQVPPLRERRDDIPDIVADIVAAFVAERGIRPVTIAPDAMRALLRYPWPGNIRELRNVVERALLLCTTSELHEHDFSFDLEVEADVPVTLAEVERQHILRTLERLHGQVDAASRELGIPRSSLYRKLKEYGIESPRRGRDVSD